MADSLDLEQSGASDRFLAVTEQGTVVIYMVAISVSCKERNKGMLLRKDSSQGLFFPVCC